MKNRNYSDKPERRFNKSNENRSGSDKPKKFDDKGGYRKDRSDDKKKFFGKSGNDDFKNKRFKSERPGGKDTSDSRDGFKSERPKRDFGKKDEFRSERTERFKSDRADKFQSDRPKKSFDRKDDFKPRRSRTDENSENERPVSRFKSNRSFNDKFKSDRYNENKPQRKRIDKSESRKPEPPDYRFEQKDNNYKRGKPQKAALNTRIKKLDADPNEIRLNRFIAGAGICSRREADKLIVEGSVKVNGKVVTELGTKIKKTDSVKLNDKVLKSEKPVYVLLNKPKDFITTLEDPEDRKTVMQLVASACDERIYPVGRLDRNTTGLLLLTNDGDLADKLSHPSSNIKKLYQVDLDKPITQEDLEKIADGVELEDGKAEVDKIEVVTPDAKSLGIELHLGKNRIVRRIFESLGYDVVKLDRVMYAGLTKKDLPRGRWRYLTEREVVRLKHFNK
jgi:23S rRNA pseudouridine2605 synthase